ncbi:hypothetical protein [Aureimonas sp. ME7]|uniref:hypothetical protein n=1 Tax=Aureimonas sp. ME7 TaxID=2744252 RepID=UPI0015F614C6|nr:hypothetical protein [Aureimonas sp. ME7]
MKLPDRFVWRPREVARGFAQAMDVIPYIGILGYPVAILLWATGLIGEAEPGRGQASWWFTGYVVALSYLPSLLVCFLVERQARKRGWPRVRMVARTVRSVHFLITYAPMLLLLVLLMLPRSWVSF